MPKRAVEAGGPPRLVDKCEAGHWLEEAAKRRHFRLVISPRCTPREPAAGGASSTPAPVQAFVPSGKPIPPTAAKVFVLSNSELYAETLHEAGRGCQALPHGHPLTPARAPYWIGRARVF